MAQNSRRAASVAVLIGLAALAAIVVVSLVTEHRPAVAAEIEPIVITPAGSSRPVTLRDRLVSGLRARLKSEIEFIDDVVLAVNLGRLPQRLVDQTYFWARIRANNARFGGPRRPISYFQPAMTARATRLGVEL